MGAQLEIGFEPKVRPWRPLKTRGFTCSRRPDGGPGTCRLWWESCPSPEKRNCFQAWFNTLPGETRNLIGYARLLRLWAAP